MSRRAIVLLQMGGPERLDEVEPFLRGLFEDAGIIRWPWPLSLAQRPLARLIARRRAPKIQERYALMGGGSPLRRETEAQAAALARELALRGEPADVIVAMRYANPRAEVAARRLAADRVEDVTVLTLYPHHSGSTTGTSLDDALAAFRAAGLTARVSVVDRWGKHPSYVALLAEQVADELALARKERGDEPVHLLMSAHGIPVAYARAGDAYGHEVEATARLLGERAEAAGYAGWRLGYQSKVGPVEWLQPYTDDVLPALAAEGARSVVAVPLGFVSDHIETLYDLDVLYREQAEALGLRYRRLPAFNDDPRFARVLADVLRDAPRREVTP